MTRAVLRLVAVAVAIAGAIDPVVTRESDLPTAVTLAIVDAHTLTGGGARSARGERALSVAAHLESELAPDRDVSVRLHMAGSQAAACPADGQCVVISDGSVPARLTDGAQVVGAVRVDGVETPRLAIVGVDASASTSLHGMSQLQVRLRSLGARGRSQVQVFDGAVLVGEGAHAWPETSVGDEVDAALAVNWVPLDRGPRRIRVVVDELEGEQTVADNEVDRTVNVTAEGASVLMYEPEPTWLGTFVRRALEDDRRFHVRGRARVAPPVVVSRGGGGLLTRQTLDSAQAVVVAAPNLLTHVEVELLERFVRVRGGSVVLLPDRRPTGSIAKLFPAIVRERRETKPVAAGDLQASELLIFASGSVGTTVLASAGADPIVISRATGRGRLIVSGALDAWRFRDLKGGFARFWTSLVADAATAAGRTIEVALQESVVAPGDRTNFSVVWQTMDDITPDIAAEAAVRCANGNGAARVWPGPRPGVFSGTIEVTGTGQCELDVSMEGVRDRGNAPFLVASDVRRPAGDARQLAAAVTAHGGLVVDTGDLAPLVARIRDVREQARHSRQTYPMRSPWWIGPFAACLSAEWWLRRRGGLR